METKVDIKSQILNIAKENGVELDVAEKIAQKCMDDMPMWRPYGGATSFADIDSSKSAQQYSAQVSDTTYALQAIIQNITDSDELDTADAKASAIQMAAEDYRKRVNALEMTPANKSIIDNVKSLFGIGEKRNYSKAQREEMAKKGEARPDGSYPIADVADLKNAIQAWGRGGATAADKAHIKKRARALGATDQLPENWKELETNHGLKVYKDKQGNARWLTHSSNAFEDFDHELFTTKALEEAVEYADKTGERGPLMFFHIPGTEVGQCDYQAMAGRFLIESGTFLDTPLGAKALEYLQETEDEHQVSIGYEYRAGDEEDGVYDWLRVKERSFLPYGTAANPWTDFKLIGEKEMDQRHQEALEKVFGKELATGIIAGAEERTKELEANVAFKAKTPAAMAEDMADGGTDDNQEDANGKKIPPKKKESEEEAPPAFSPEQFTQLATLLTDLSSQVEKISGIETVVTSLQEEIKELKKSDDEKIAAQMSPRFDPSKQGVRPSESNSNVLDEKTLTALKHISEENQEPEKSPAQQYVDDLLKGVFATPQA